MPVLMAKRAINEGVAGGSLEIWVTDTSAPDDFETFARLEGHTISWERLDDMVSIKLLLKPPVPGERA